MDPAFSCNLAAERDLDFTVHIILINVGEQRGFIQCGWKGQGLPLPISLLYRGKTLKQLWLKGTAAVLIPEGVPFWHKFVSLIDGEFGDGGQKLQP